MSAEAILDKQSSQPVPEASIGGTSGDGELQTVTPRKMTATEAAAARRARILQRGGDRMALVTGSIKTKTFEAEQVSAATPAAIAPSPHNTPAESVDICSPLVIPDHPKIALGPVVDDLAKSLCSPTVVHQNSTRFYPESPAPRPPSPKPFQDVTYLDSVEESPIIGKDKGDREINNSFSPTNVVSRRRISSTPPKQPHNHDALHIQEHNQIIKSELKQESKPDPKTEPKPASSQSLSSIESNLSTLLTSKSSISKWIQLIQLLAYFVFAALFFGSSSIPLPYSFPKTLDTFVASFVLLEMTFFTVSWALNYSKDLQIQEVSLQREKLKASQKQDSAVSRDDESGSHPMDLLDAISGIQSQLEQSELGKLAQKFSTLFGYFSKAEAALERLSVFLFATVITQTLLTQFNKV